MYSNNVFTLDSFNSQSSAQEYCLYDEFLASKKGQFIACTCDILPNLIFSATISNGHKFYSQNPFNWHNCSKGLKGSTKLSPYLFRAKTYSPAVKGCTFFLLTVEHV